MKTCSPAPCALPAVSTASGSPPSSSSCHASVTAPPSLPSAFCVAIEHGLTAPASWFARSRSGMSESSSPNGSARERQIAWAHRKRSREKASAGKVSRSAANVDASSACHCSASSPESWSTMPCKCEPASSRARSSSLHSSGTLSSAAVGRTARYGAHSDASPRPTSCSRRSASRLLSSSRASKRDATGELDAARCSRRGTASSRSPASTSRAATSEFPKPATTPPVVVAVETSLEESQFLRPSSAAGAASDAARSRWAGGAGSARGTTAASTAGRHLRSRRDRARELDARLTTAPPRKRKRLSGESRATTAARLAIARREHRHRRRRCRALRRAPSQRWRWTS